MGLKKEGLISGGGGGGASNRNKKTVSKRATPLLIEKRFSFTGF